MREFLVHTVLCFYSIRREFLEHIESWRKEAILRAESIMTAKVSIFLVPNLIMIASIPVFH